MNGAQLHLSLNHLPIVTSILTLLLLLWAWKSKSSDLRKAGLVFAVLGALFCAAGYFTGEPAEDVLKALPNYPRSFVHEHEEAAEFALIVNCVSAVAALVALFVPRQKIRDYAFIAVVALTLLSCTILLRTAHLGGLIKHEEIRAK